MASYDAYVGGGENITNSRPFDSDGYMGFDPRLQSQRFETFGMPEESFGEDHFTQEDGKQSGDLDEEDEFGSRKERTGSNGAFDAMGTSPPPPYHSGFDDDLGSSQSPPLSSSTFGQSFESRLHSEFPADDFSPSMDSNGKGLAHEDSFSQSDGFGYGGPPPPGFLNGEGAVLPPPEEMEAEEGFLLREWRRKNAIHLEEKARNESEKLSQVIDAADSYKDSFYDKRRTHCEATKKNNRDKEKVFLENHKDFHANADKHYWKAVAELIPHELPSMETKSRGKKDQKKPSVVMNHGPKPGKATDLSRMRQVLVKLKHNPPAHMKPPPPPPAPTSAANAEGTDGKASAKVSVEGGDGKAMAPIPSAAPLQKQGSIPTAAPLQKQGSIPTAAVA